MIKHNLQTLTVPKKNPPPLVSPKTGNAQPAEISHLRNRSRKKILTINKAYVKALSSSVNHISGNEIRNYKRSGVSCSSRP
jgi:hypothetical protein